MSAENPHQEPLLPLSHKHRRGRSASRRRCLRGRSPSGKSNRRPCKNFLKGTCTELPCDCLHPHECQFYTSETGCEFGNECPFLHRKVEEQSNKRPKKGGDKSAVIVVNGVRQLGYVSQDAGPPESVSISRKGAQKFWDRFDEYDSQELRCVKQTSEKAKVHRSEWLKSKILISAVRTPKS